MSRMKRKSIETSSQKMNESEGASSSNPICRAAEGRRAVTRKKGRRAVTRIKGCRRSLEPRGAGTASDGHPRRSRSCFGS
eukprot:4243024-Prymnesium_polylepis.1